MSNPHFNRRTFLGGMGASALLTLSGCAGESEFQSETQYDEWEARATQLENITRLGYDDFSEESPGEWAGKEATHVPQVELNGRNLYAYVNHPMELEHWITTIYVRDQNRKVVYLQEFVPNSVATISEEVQAALDMAFMETNGYALIRFRLPAETTSFTVYAFCNKHDNWKTATYSV